jgi:hypothetical protein
MPVIPAYDIWYPEFKWLYWIIRCDFALCYIFTCGWLLSSYFRRFRRGRSRAFLYFPPIAKIYVSTPTGISNGMRNWLGWTWSSYLFVSNCRQYWEFVKITWHLVRDSTFSSSQDDFLWSRVCNCGYLRPIAVPDIIRISTAIKCTVSRLMSSSFHISILTDHILSKPKKGPSRSHSQGSTDPSLQTIYILISSQKFQSFCKFEGGSERGRQEPDARVYQCSNLQTPSHFGPKLRLWKFDSERARPIWALFS